MSTPEVVVHKDRDLLAEAVAARLVTRIVAIGNVRLVTVQVVGEGEVGAGEDPWHGTCSRADYDLKRGRVEMQGAPGQPRPRLLRANGVQYRDIEASGYFYVVARIECRFKAPAYYDDVIVLTTTITRQTRARIDHAYVIRREGRILCEATSTLACVDRSGRPTPIPEDILHGKPKQPITPHTDRINP